jgi:hypothetical protein
VKLLTTGNPKTVKGLAKGFLSFILHLAPDKLSGYNMCPMASAGCRFGCLNTAGRGGFDPRIQKARIRKTLQYMEQRDTFMAQLVKDIRSGIRSANRKGLTPVFRLNGTSDVRWETVPVTVDGVVYPNIMSAFATVQFYDYTKIPNRKNLPANYHLTFSRSETNDALIPTVPYNTAVVFSTRKGVALPDTYMGMTVVDGDDTDLRFLDTPNVIVGLRAKGKAKKDDTGFVVKV